jgi:hypothetical protein
MATLSTEPFSVNRVGKTGRGVWSTHLVEDREYRLDDRGSHQGPQPGDSQQDLPGTIPTQSDTSIKT